MAELAERAQIISQEAGSKVSAAMKDVISAAAGIAGFAIESARDLVQFMVRRGQMTPEEGEKLIREAEAAHDKRSPAEKGRSTATRIAADKAAAAKAEAAARAAAQAAVFSRPIAKPPAPASPDSAKSGSHKAVPLSAARPASVSKAAAPPKGKPVKPPKAAKASKPSKPAKKRK